MKISEADILIAPGLGNSGPAHWQRRWAGRMTTARIIEQDDWNAPVLADWVARIHRDVMMATRPVAFLVSPPDFDAETLPATAKPFKPPTDPLPFPSMVVASNSDPLVRYERAQEFAADWGSDFQSAGDAGHINAASGHGPWPEGLLLFAELMKRLKA